MGTLLGKANAGVDMNNIQQVIEDFNLKMEQQENMGEMIQDAFDDDEEDIEDNEVDALINQIQDKVGGGSGGDKNVIK